MWFFVLAIADGVRNYVTLLAWGNRHDGHEPVALLKNTIREVQRKVRDPPAAVWRYALSMRFSVDIAARTCGQKKIACLRYPDKREG